MKKLLSSALHLVATSAFLLCAAPLANARDSGNWSVNIGIPVSGYTVYEQADYYPPAPVYYRPQPVYVQPAPVYYPSYQPYAVPARPYGAIRYDYRDGSDRWEHRRYGHGDRHGVGHRHWDQRGHENHRGRHWRDE